jgi:SAM-dependent methyltransferase
MLKTSSTFHASDGAAYERWLGRWARRLAPPFIDFAGFAGDGDLLDVGCGTGALTAAMAQRWPGRRVIGVDLADDFIAFARAQRRGRAIFAPGDACALNYDDGTFAGTAAQLLLLFVPQPELALNEMRRVTRSGGRVAAAVWDSRGGLVFQRMLWDTAVTIDPRARRVRDRLFAHPLAIPGGLATLFRDAGLDQIASASLTIRMDFADFADYWEPLLGGQGPVGSYFAELDEDLKGRIRAALRDAYCSGADDGPRSFTATAWAVRGTVP